MLHGAASTLLAPLVDRADLRLVEVVRTRLAVHYATSCAVLPLVCVATADAVLLPNTLVTDRLPRAAVLEPVGWRVTRWWRPPRPAGLPLPAPEAVARLPRPPYDTLEPDALVGRGEGLTPQGDDLLAAALVTARATGDPRLPRWRARTRTALRTRRTTAVSRAVLGHALEGYAVPELADLLRVLCTGGDVDRATRRLSAVGHTSGTALLDGVALTLTTRIRPRREGVA